MRPIWVVAMATVNEAIRRRVLNIFLLVALVMIASLQFLKPFSPGEERKFIIDIGINSIRLFSILILVVLGATMIPQEIERKTIHTLLAKPITRGQFVFGKFLGMAMTVLGSAVLMGIVFLIVFYIHSHYLDVNVVWATILVLFELLVFASVVTFLSSFCSPMLVVVASVLVWIVGNVREYLDAIQAAGNAFTQGVTMVLAAVFPAFERFDLTKAIMLDIHVVPPLIYGPIVYAAAYTAIMMGLSYVIFNAREF